MKDQWRKPLFAYSDEVMKQICQQIIFFHFFDFDLSFILGMIWSLKFSWFSLMIYFKNHLCPYIQYLLCLWIHALGFCGVCLWTLCHSQALNLCLSCPCMTGVGLSSLPDKLGQYNQQHVNESHVSLTAKPKTRQQWVGVAHLTEMKSKRTAQRAAWQCYRHRSHSLTH